MGRLAAGMLAAALTLGAVGCSIGPVWIDVPHGLESEWRAILDRSPLPHGLEVRPVGRDAGRAEPLIVLSSGKHGEGAGLQWKLAARAALVPLGRLGADKGSVPAPEAASGLIPLVSLRDIQLPDTALAVDGLYPGQPGYPFLNDVSVGIRGKHPALRQWFESLTESPDPQLLWVGAVGDIMPARGVDAILLGGSGAQKIFGDTLPELASCGFLLGNLEAAAAREGARQRKSFTFRFDPAAIRELAAVGFSYLSVTNNHSFDFGPTAFVQTLKELDASGIGSSGAGEDLEQARRAWQGARGSLRIRVLSFGAYPAEAGGFDGQRDAAAGPGRPGILWLDDASAAAAAVQFPPEGFNIAVVHGGEEWASRPTLEQMRLYRALVSVGADLVVGAHPHVLQGMESYRGKLIAYSLGNFVFPGMGGTPGGEDSVILKVGVFEGKIRAVRPVGVRLEGAAVRLDRTGTAVRVLLKRTRELAAR
jgi:hypothetical protein